MTETGSTGISFQGCNLCPERAMPVQNVEFEFTDESGITYQGRAGFMENEAIPGPWMITYDPQQPIASYFPDDKAVLKAKIDAFTLADTFWGGELSLLIGFICQVAERFGFYEETSISAPIWVK